MAPSDLQLQIDATSSYLRLLKEAQECRNLYNKASIPLPEPLLRLLGESSGESKQLLLRSPGPDVDPSRMESRPPEATDGWISLRAKDVSPTTLALAILRASSDPLKSGDVVDRVTRILPGTVGGSVYNLLNRLAGEGYILASMNGWTLMRKDVAGILSGEYVWGHPDRLAKTDLAAHRREAILYILSSEGALQVMQIVEKLIAWEWVKAPVNKDLLKTDMQILDGEGLVKRVGSSRKWQAVGG